MLLKSLPTINVGAMRISYGNIGGFVLLVANTVRFVLAYFFAHDLSKEFDLKAHELELSSRINISCNDNNNTNNENNNNSNKSKVNNNGENDNNNKNEENNNNLRNNENSNNNNDNNNDNENSNVTNKRSSWRSMKQYFSFDVIFLLVQQIYTGFFVSWLGRIFPFIVETFGYNDFILDISFIGASVAMTAIAFIVSKLNLSSRGVYVCGILCLLFLLICQVLLYLVPMKLAEWVNILLLSAFLFIYGFCWITDQTFIVVTLGKMFPSEVQSSIEGIRNHLHLCGSFTASLASAYIFRYFDIVGKVSLPFLLGLICVLILRRSFLSNPCVTKMTPPTPTTATTTTPIPTTATTETTAPTPPTTTTPSTTTTETIAPSTTTTETIATSTAATETIAPTTETIALTAATVQQ